MTTHRAFHFQRARAARRVLLAALVLAAGCGGGSPPPAAPTTTPAPADPRTALEQRRDTACEQIQPRLTECAIQDAKQALSPAEYAKLRPEELRTQHKAKFLDECRGSAMSSRQVRVLEVCFREETSCGPLAECLKNLAPATP